MKLGNIELLAGRMDILLAAAECDGRNTVGSEPVGVEAAVRDRKFGSEVFRLDCRGGRNDTRFLAAQAK